MTASALSRDALAGACSAALFFGCAMLDTTIEFVSPTDIPSGGAGLVVVPLEAGQTTAERYRRPGDGPFESGEPLVAIVRTSTLSSADDVEVVEAERKGREIRVRIDVESYVGPLLGNVTQVGLVEVHLGALPLGEYEVRAEVRTRPSDDSDAPTTREEETVSVEEASFHIRAL